MASPCFSDSRLKNVMWKELHRFDCMWRVKILSFIFQAPVWATPPVVGDHVLSVTLKSLLYILSDFQQVRSIHEYNVQHHLWTESHGSRASVYLLFFCYIPNRHQSSQSSWTSTTSCLIKFLLVTLYTLWAMILWHVFTVLLLYPSPLYSKAMTRLSGGSLVKAWKTSLKKYLELSTCNIWCFLKIVLIQGRFTLGMDDACKYNFASDSYHPTVHNNSKTSTIDMNAGGKYVEQLGLTCAGKRCC